MGDDSTTRPSGASFERPVPAGVASGVGGGVGMGVLLHGVVGVMPFLGSLYGWPTVLGGWIAHLVNSVLLGPLYGFVVSRAFVRSQFGARSDHVRLGIVSAAVIGLFSAGVVLPVTVDALAVPELPATFQAFPDATGGILLVVAVSVAHLFDGVLLGITYGRIDRSRSGDDPRYGNRRDDDLRDDDPGEQ